MKCCKKFLCTLLLSVMMCTMLSGVVKAQSTSEGAPQAEQENTKEKKDGKMEVSSEEFTARVVCGFSGNFRIGAPVPTSIYLESLNEDFEGVARIIVPSNGDGNSKAIAYEKEVLLTAGTQKVINMSINNQSGSGTLFFELEDTKGKKVLEKKILLTSKYDDSALVGVLSDDYTALNYFDNRNIELSNYTGLSKVVELDAETFPEVESGLEALAYIIINSFDTSKLSEAQMTAIEKWVASGGVLIIGTGSDYQQTLSGIKESLISGKIDGTIAGELCIKGKEKYKTTFEEKDGVLNLKVEDGGNLEDIMSEEGLVYNHDHGSGHVIMTAFNLGMEPVNSWKDKNTIASKILNNSAVGASSSRISKINYQEGEDAWYFRSAMESLFSSKLPNVPGILIVLLIFIAFGPVAYFVLKKADKRGILWVLIPLTSIVATAGIYVVTGNIRIKNIESASLTIVTNDEIDGNNEQTDVAISLLVPSAEKMETNITGEIGNLNIVSDSDYYSSMSGSANSQKDYKIALRENSEGYHVRLKNGETFASDNFSGEVANSSNIASLIDIDVKLTTKGISGSVTNNSDIDLEGVCLLYYSKATVIPKLKAGETVDLKNCKTDPYYEEDSFHQFDYGCGEDNVLREKMAQCYSYAYSKYNFYGGYSDSNMTLVGFIDKWNADYIPDKKVKEYNSAVVIKNIRVKLEDYENAYVYDMKSFAPGQQDWDSYDGEMYADEVEVECDVKDTFDKVYVLQKGESRSSRFGPYDNTKTYLYNYENNKYEEIFKKDDYMEFKNGCPYLSDKGKMKFKFENAVDSPRYSPQITIVGGEE